MHLAEVVTVSDARANLSRILSDLHDSGSGAEPVFIGAHRKAEGVLLSLELYERLLAAHEHLERAADVASAWGSTHAEGLDPSPQTMRDADEYINGQVSIDELVERVIVRHKKV
jgi:PHD/YefM family antitoxin component YafN of YafNO toxin-antitoxin module